MSPLSPLVRLVIFLGSWLVWFSALLVLRNHRRENAVRVDPKGRWGIALQMAGYVVACMQGPELWSSDLDLWRALAGIVIALLSIAIFWSAVGSLGKQWRFDAGLNQDHELVQAGAYRLCGIRFMRRCSVCFWRISAGARCLDGRLRRRCSWRVLRFACAWKTGCCGERFGEKFVEWQRAKPAYLPFVR